jgi:hypothetical protein
MTENGEWEANGGGLGRRSLPLKEQEKTIAENNPVSGKYFLTLLLK